MSQVTQERADNRIIFTKILSNSVAHSLVEAIEKMPGSDALYAMNPKANLKNLYTHISTLEQLYYPLSLANNSLYTSLKEDIILRQKMGYDLTMVLNSLNYMDYLNARQRLIVYLSMIDPMEKFNEVKEPMIISVSNSQCMTVLSMNVSTDALDQWLQYSWSPKLWGATYDIHLVNNTMVVRIVPSQS